MRKPTFPRTVPQVNNNGTSRDELIQQRRDVLGHLRKSILALTFMTPHGRDFQTVEIERYDEARALHRIRVTAVAELLDDIEAEALAIQDQGIRSRQPDMLASSAADLDGEGDR